MVRKAVDLLSINGIGLAYTFQNMTEFWNALTRPLSRNGFGLSIEDCANDAGEIEENFLRLTDNDTVYNEWRRIVVKHSISGVKVHDARLAASMYAHDLTHILTFNVADFARFDGITAIHPDSVEREFSSLP
jgi:predicted nucleic acid-binding protein